VATSVFKPLKGHWDHVTRTCTTLHRH